LFEGSLIQRPESRVLGCDHVGQNPTRKLPPDVFTASSSVAPTGLA